MQAPSIGGVIVPRGDGSTVVRVRQGASMTDFADKINANPASLVTVLFNLGEMATATQSLDEETFQLLGAELGYDIQIVSPEEEERELFDSFDINLEIGVDAEDEEDLERFRGFCGMQAGEGDEREGCGEECGLHGQSCRFVVPPVCLAVANVMCRQCRLMCP